MHYKNDILGRDERLGSEGAVAGNPFNFCEFPFFITKGTDGAGFQPALDAIQVEDVAAAAKRDGEAIFIIRGRIRLIFDRRLI